MTFFVPGRITNPLNGSHGHWSVRARWAKDERGNYLTIDGCHVLEAL